jgi:hypothetical protein
MGKCPLCKIVVTELPIVKTEPAEVAVPELEKYTRTTAHTDELVKLQIHVQKFTTDLDEYEEKRENYEKFVARVKDLALRGIDVSQIEIAKPERPRNTFLQLKLVANQELGSDVGQIAVWKEKNKISDEDMIKILKEAVDDYEEVDIGNVAQIKIRILPTGRIYNATGLINPDGSGWFIPYKVVVVNNIPKLIFSKRKETHIYKFGGTDTELEKILPFEGLCRALFFVGNFIVEADRRFFQIHSAIDGSEVHRGRYEDISNSEMRNAVLLEDDRIACLFDNPPRIFLFDNRL